MKGQIFVVLFVVVSLIVVYFYYNISLYNRNVADFERTIDTLYSLDFSSQEYLLETSENVVYLSLLASVNSSDSDGFQQETKRLIQGQYGSVLGTSLVPYDDRYVITFCVPERIFESSKVRINMTEKCYSKTVYMPILELFNMSSSFDGVLFDSCISSYDCSNYTEGMDFCLAELSDEPFLYTFSLQEPPCIANRPHADIFVHKMGNFISSLFPHYVGSV